MGRYRRQGALVLLTKVLLFVSLVWVFAVDPALAQIAAKKPGTTVRTRANAELDPSGIRADSMMIYPSISVSGQYDDNLFIWNVISEDDVVLIVAPTVRVKSLWSHHELQFFASGQFGFHKDFPGQDYKNFIFQGQGTIDISNKTNLVLAAGYRQAHELRIDPDAISEVIEPPQYQTPSASFKFTHRFNRLTASIGGRVKRTDYDNAETIDGDVVDQSFRDRNQFHLEARLDYEFQQNVGVFINVVRNWRRYDSKIDNRGFTRDSDGYNIDLGIDLRFTSIIFGHAYIGYTKQHYDDLRFDNVDGLNYGADIDWNITSLTSVNLGVERRLRDTIQFFSPGYYADRVKLQVDHELRQDWIVSVMGMTGQNRFQQIGRQEKVWNIGAQLYWKMNRNFRVRLSYMYDRRDTEFVGVGNYKRNTVTFGVEANY
jgi:hypothetical protein